jgi:hypothetical protein
MMTSRDEIWVNQGMETKINVLETMPSKLQLPNYLDKSSCHMVCTRKLYPVERRWLPDESTLGSIAEIQVLHLRRLSSIFLLDSD